MILSRGVVPSLGFLTTRSRLFGRIVLPGHATALAGSAFHSSQKVRRRPAGDFPAQSSLAARQKPSRKAGSENETSFLGLAAELSKARLSALVVMTTGAGALFAGPALGSGGTVAAACLGTAMCAASANTFNQCYEIKTDALMARTAKRPLPSGRVTLPHALGFGGMMGALGVSTLLAGCNPMTAAMGAANIGIYSCMYTPMKQTSEWNTWVGSVVGAIPPMMGFTAVTGQVVSAESALLAGVLFLWQFPHFFSLAWLNREGYAAGGHRMVPCADPTGMRTAAIVRKYTAALLPLPAVAVACGLTSSMFAIEAFAVNSYWLYQAQQFYQKPSNGNARRVFRTSLWYLPVVLGLMVFHSRHWIDSEDRVRAIDEDPDPLRRIYRYAASVLRPIGRENCPHEVLGGQPGYHDGMFSPSTERKSNTSGSEDGDTAAKAGVLVSAKAHS